MAGQEVSPGDALVDGPKDPKELLEIKGIRETQQYLVEEVQKVYRDQGVSIHDKHIELIVRQMLRRVLVAEPGDSAVPSRRARRQPAYAAVPAAADDPPRALGRGPIPGEVLRRMKACIQPRAKSTRPTARPSRCR